MTAPLADRDSDLRLRAVARWDVPALRGGLRALTELDDNFPSWRARLDGVVRRLEDDGCWSGPAAAQAREVLLRLSTAAAMLDAGFADSRAECARVVREAVTAADRAATALALAPELPLPLTGTFAGGETPAAAFAAVAGALDRLVLGPESVSPAVAAARESVAAARESLAAADAAQAAADRAADVLHPVGVLASADLAGLLASAGSVHFVLAPPAGPDPAAVARWWAALPADAQLTLVATAAGTVGSMDGVPAWARDRANRHTLRQAIEDPRADDDLRATARVVARVLAVEDDAGRRAQLYLLDLAGDRVAVAFGDLDSADAVALVIPGVGTSPADDLGAVSADARDLGAAVGRADPVLAVATVAWLGYRTPHTPRSTLTRRAGARGGAALDTALDGLAAARGSAGSPAPRTTLIGHSYGTVVLDEAADRPGRLAADAIVLLGSPGMEDDAASLEVPEVYDAASPADPISWSGWFGTETWASRFGSTGLPVEPGTGHSDYFDRDRPTLDAMGEVVAGRRGD